MKRCLQLQVMPIDTAIVLEHLEQRVTRAEVFTHQGMAPQGEFLSVLAQHQQTGGVVDLRIHQQHRGNTCVAQGSRRLQRMEGLDLLQHIGRGVDQQPIGLVGSDCNGRLGACHVVRATRPHCTALRAIAIPLREPAASG